MCDASRATQRVSPLRGKSALAHFRRASHDSECAPSLPLRVGQDPHLSHRAQSLRWQRSCAYVRRRATRHLSCTALWGPASRFPHVSKAVNPISLIQDPLWCGEIGLFRVQTCSRVGYLRRHCVGNLLVLLVHIPQELEAVGEPLHARLLPHGHHLGPDQGGCGSELCNTPSRSAHHDRKESTLG